MNTFPTFKHSPDSRVVPRDGRSEDERSDGVMDVVKTHPDKADANLKLWMTAAELATFLAFYVANSQFTYVDPTDSTNYTMGWGKGAYQKQWVSPVNGGTYWVFVRLVGQ